MKILLNLFPPATYTNPDLGLSVLKSFLMEQGVDCEILYWNLILKEITDKFPSYQDNDLASVLLPYILDHSKDNIEQLAFFLKAKNPKWLIYDTDYYNKFLVKTNNKIHAILDDVILKKNIAFSYNLIGLQYKFIQWVPGLIFAKKLKKINPHLKIVVGGIGNKAESVKFIEIFKDTIDFAIWGEGEVALSQLCNHIQNGNIHLSDIQSLIYVEDGEIKSTNVKRIYSDFVIPDYSDYFQQIKNKKIVRYLPIEKSRGCHWNRCKFCYLNSGYSHYRTIPNERILEIISVLRKRHKIDRLCFYDNDLFGNGNKEVESFLDDLIEYNKDRKIEFLFAEVSSKNTTKDIICKSAQAGFKNFQIGIEAISDRKLNKIKKESTFINHILAIKFCAQNQIDIRGANIITHFPDDDIHDVMESADNLSYLRFYLNKGISLQCVPLMVRHNSLYYKDINTEKWCSEIDSMINNSLINENGMFLFEFYNKENFPFWSHFHTLHNFYSNTKYTYTITYSTDLVSFTEYFNDKEILYLEFSLNEWELVKIICDTYYTYENLYEKIKEQNLHFSKKEIKSFIKSLKKEKLIYENDKGEFITIFTY